MLVDPADDGAPACPATTRYESPGGGTETSTERRIIFSPEIAGRRIGERAPRVGGRSARRSRACARPRGTDRASQRRRDPRRDRPRGAALRRHRDAATRRATSSSGAGRACSPTALRDAPTARRLRRRARCRGRRLGRGHVLRLHAARQAVQLDGAARRGSADRRAARRRAHQRRGCRGDWRGGRHTAASDLRPGTFEGQAFIAPPSRQPRGALARGHALLAAEEIDPAPASPTTTPSSDSR